MGNRPRAFAVTRGRLIQVPVEGLLGIGRPASGPCRRQRCPFPLGYLAVEGTGAHRWEAPLLTEQAIARIDRPGRWLLRGGIPGGDRLVDGLQRRLVYTPPAVAPCAHPSEQ